MASLRGTKAFTLIELLVVIGLIALLAGGIGLAFGGGDKSNALQGAQGTLQSMMSAVRGQAALSGYDAALFVDSDTSKTTTGIDPQNFLRSFVIAVKNSSGAWTVVGDRITLPSGIYLVPSATGTSFGGKAEVPSTYNDSDHSGAISDAFTGTSGSLFYSDGATPFTGTYSLVIQLTSRGTKSSSGSRLVLSPAKVTAGSDGALSITFENSDLVRGAIISDYGVVTPVNNASGFGS